MEIFPKNFSIEHHAYFLNYKKGVVEVFKDFLKERFGIEERQNPDYFHQRFNVLSIDDGRKIKELHKNKAFNSNSKRIFIIECISITHEAQNALLKIFEEPNSNTHFFLFMPRLEVLLPTLISRLLVIDHKHEGDNADCITEAKDFLNMNIKDRLVFVNKIAKEFSEDKVDRLYILTLLSSLEKILYERSNIKDLKPNTRRAFNSILKVKDYVNDRAPSIKQLLEYVAVSV